MRHRVLGGRFWPRWTLDLLVRAHSDGRSPGPMPGLTSEVYINVPRDTSAVVRGNLPDIGNEGKNVSSGRADTGRLQLRRKVVFAETRLADGFGVRPVSKLKPPRDRFSRPWRRSVGATERRATFPQLTPSIRVHGRGRAVSGRGASGR